MDITHGSDGSGHGRWEVLLNSFLSIYLITDSEVPSAAKSNATL
jgi:hypothetical protein